MLIGGRSGWVMGEVLERSVELSGSGWSPEVNEEVGRVESVSNINDAGVGGRKRMGKHFPQT